MNEKQVVAFSIDKVQTFLTEVIHSHVQEKQTEKATLRNIMSASRDISVNFYSTIRNEFSEVEIQEFLSCSGVLIFSCTLSEEKINEKLNKLFLYYYNSSQGQKLLRCVVFPQNNFNECQAIKKAKKSLKKSCYLNKMIEQNKHTLFSFSKGVTVSDLQNQDEIFASDIDSLFCGEQKNEQKRFRIAVIKADLDGMGNMFENINDYDLYKKISDIINQYVSLDCLGTIAKELHPSKEAKWIFPFYIAGDDIFFAVSIENLQNGINLCNKILINIKEKLKKIDSQANLSMSIGVELTFNCQPIRYYMEMVEKQLKNAKKTATPNVLEEDVYSKISIGGLTFLSIDYKRVKEKNKDINIKKSLVNYPIWNFFMNDIRLLNYIQSHDKYSQLIGTPGFFYTLLEKITDETIKCDETIECDEIIKCKNTKYLNNVLYHLLPKYHDSSDKNLKNLELLLNANIIQQLYKKDKKEKSLNLESDSKHRLEIYLRLMLLFSDIRFNKIKNLNLEKKLVLNDKNINISSKLLFTKTANYLYNQLKTTNQELLNIFAKKQNYAKNNQGIAKYECLQMLNVEKSMFFKLRDRAKVPIKKAANMIKLKNNDGLSDVQEKNNQRKKDGKAPYHLYFDMETFCNISPVVWTSDFVDSLMLLYEYKQLSI